MHTLPRRPGPLRTSYPMPLSTAGSGKCFPVPSLNPFAAPPLKLKQSGWAGNYALGSSYIALPWWAGQVRPALVVACEGAAKALRGLAQVLHRAAPVGGPAVAIAGGWLTSGAQAPDGADSP